MCLLGNPEVGGGAIGDPEQSLALQLKFGPEQACAESDLEQVQELRLQTLSRSFHCVALPLLVLTLSRSLQHLIFGLVQARADLMATGSGASTTYAGKAHEHIPEFSGKSGDYKEYRKRLLLYEKKMKLANRGGETSFNVLRSLKGRAWDACEDISMQELEGDSGMKLILERLDRVFKFDAITELPADFETFFIGLSRRKSQNIQEYSAEFERALRKLQQHQVQLPDKVVGWWYLRRAGLSKEQRQMIMTTMDGEKLSLETVRKGVNFVIGQDTVPDAHSSNAGRWNRSGKDSIYYEDDAEYYDDWDEWEPDEDDIQWADEGASYYEDDECEETYAAHEDAATEYDEVLANYVEAKQKLAQLRVSRGFFPVVALAPDGRGHGGKGSSKGKHVKGKGKTKSKQLPRPPPRPKERGRAALGSSKVGASKCLCCGQAGHWARDCPTAGAGKRKAETEAGDAMMVTFAESTLKLDESSDAAMLDCGAASVIASKFQLRKYVNFLKAVGFKVDAIPVWRCSKGFRFGNGNMNTTQWCTLLPTFFGGVRRDFLAYVIEGEAPILLGRPLMEAMDLSVNYAQGEIRFGTDPWIPAEKGLKGEYIIHLAADVHGLLDVEPQFVYLPEDFDSHVQPVQHSMDQLLDNEEILAVEPNHDAEQDLQPDPQQVSPNLIFAEHKSDNDLKEPHDASFTSKTHAGECNETPMTAAEQPPVQDDAAEVDKPKNEHKSLDYDLCHLPPGKLRHLMHLTAKDKKEFDRILSCASTGGNVEKKKPYVIWEIFAGAGRVTKTANRRNGCKAERFSLEDGWDFNLASHRKAFFKRLKQEQPDCCLVMPPCKLWSMLQELTVAKHPDYMAKLTAMRQENHDNLLTFAALVYEYQRRNGKLGVAEHPRKSRAWSTKAFKKMQGFDTHVDQCCYGLQLPDDSGVVNPVQKPTCFRATGKMFHDLLQCQCDGQHRHTRLEGSIPGVGLRSKLAEDFPQELATAIVDAICAQLDYDTAEIYANDAGDVALSPAEEFAEMVEQHQREQSLQQEHDAEVEVEQTEQNDPVALNKALRKKVGGRAVDYVQRLHKNLGHPSHGVLEKMLAEVQATSNVLEAARDYVCPACYARKPPFQNPPASSLKCTEFNDRILVDSHWIQCEDSIIKRAEPAPGTPAHKRREKNKAEKAFSGRQCVLTIIDHATRFCSVRILKSERADEFTKGLERAWIKHFGLPRLLRIDEAKGWASKHVREWAASRGIELEVQPAENHSWLSVVERKHQVVRRALELYQDDIGRHDVAALKEACIYVPHSINQLSFHRGFSPQQWVLGKSMNYTHGLSGEIFNPGQEALDDQGAFANVQQKRVNAAQAFIRADSDAKLRRAFTQKFVENRDEVVVGQRCWYWRDAGAGILRKARWRGPARVVAVEPVGDSKVLWLCHGTSLVRCGPRQVRPVVEETGVAVPADRAAAMRDLEELKARSTTQFKDALKRAGGNPDVDELMGDENEIEAEYEPSIYQGDLPPDELAETSDESPQGSRPGVVQMFFPQPPQQQQHDDGSERGRERSPRRRLASDASTTLPMVLERPAAESRVVSGSPKRKDHASLPEEESHKKPRGDVARSSTSTPAEIADAAANQAAVETPVPTADDDLVIDVMMVDDGGDLPDGWKCVDGAIEMDDNYMVQLRKGEVNMKLLSPEERADFVDAKRKELENYFANFVWEFASDKEKKDAEKDQRVITARWVLTWKCEDENAEVPKWKAKARLVLRGYEDPDVMTLNKASPTASRQARLWLLTLTKWNSWQLICADVKAAFLSGSNFDRVIIVRLPADCGPLLGVNLEGISKHVFMRLKKSAYGLSDAPLLWYQEASRTTDRDGMDQTPHGSMLFHVGGKRQAL